MSVYIASNSPKNISQEHKMAQLIEEQIVEAFSSSGHKIYTKDFIWCKEEWPKINHNDFDDGDEIPIISLKGILDGNKNDIDYNKVCKAMVSASQKWGFFKLVDHGVAFEIMSNVKISLSNFFDLEMEEKLKGARSVALPLGYSASNPDYVKNLPWAEIIQLLQSPQQINDFAKRVLGDQHQAFSDPMNKYMIELDKLGMTILGMLAHGLGLPSDFFIKNFHDKMQTIIRANNYPPCPLPEKCLGLGSHSDPHTMTILLQDDNVAGLQVLKEKNQWVGVRPVPNSFVINIGDTLEAWTNGRLKSVIHRAVVNKKKKRLSIAYFLSPSADTLIDSPPQLVDNEKNPKIYLPFTWGNFRRVLLEQKRVVGKTALDRYLITSQD